MIDIKVIKIFLKIILIIVFLSSSYNIFISIKKYNDSKKIYKEIRNEKENIDLSSINSDYIGWITIKNSSIDYPIVKGVDNEFYLKRDFNKNYLFAGSIFMDYRNKGFQDKNVVIYGHHMKDNSMFGSLKKYKDLDYLKENRYINITTKDGEKFIYEIFGVYITTSYDSEIISVKFNNEEDFSKYINKVHEKSIYDLGVEVKGKDKILTLATCSYEFNDARLVIHAKHVG